MAKAGYKDRTADEVVRESTPLTRAD
jgi:hypothetical protein